MVDYKFFQRHKPSASRKEASRNRLVNIYIVGEGAATEKNYFKSFNNFSDGKYRILLKYEQSPFSHCLSVALRNKKDYDMVWLVFDYDNRGAAFGKKIEEADKKGVRCAWSNWSFELWLLNHFKDVGGYAEQRDLEEQLTKFLGRKYSKTIKDIRGVITDNGGDESAAIRRAERQFLNGFDNDKPSLMNPCTRVFELVRILLLEDTSWLDDGC